MQKRVELLVDVVVDKDSEAAVQRWLDLLPEVRAKIIQYGFELQEQESLKVLAQMSGDW